jgi:3-(3-hydroxy-phenyl)propionate hydroxylase
VAELRECEIAIVGCGPTGATLAGLLGRAGIDTVVLERAREVYPQPRAVGFDHDAMRIFQRVGVADRLGPHTEPFRPTEYLGLQGRVIQRVQPIDPPYPLTWPPSLTCDQPGLEAVLRARLGELPAVRASFGASVMSVACDDDGATLSIEDDAGGSERLRARYVVACDGASSPLRRALGIGLASMNYDAAWVVVDLDVDPAHLPRLPATNVQYCEPERPATHIVCPGTHRRWEFMLLEGEREGELDSATLWRLLARWVSPGQARIRRAASYRFHALIAATWRAGRVLLAGDAAHQTPPFLGQGMCQGIRDAGNLAWKLVRLLRGQAGDALLASYEEERAPHVARTTRLALEFGRMMSERDPAAARARDERLAGGPAGARTLRRQALIPGLEAGLIAAGAARAGEVFPQPVIAARDGRDILFDDLGEPGFRLVLRGPGPGVAALVARARAAGCAAFALAPVEGALAIEEAAPLLADWLGDACGALVRPDHYTFGAFADACEGVALIDDLESRAGMRPASTPAKETSACAS